VQNIAEKAIERFGGFDTWVNNAGVSVYGSLLEVPIHDMRRLFETNLWGVIHGSLIAARHLKERGGVIINIGSTLSDRAIPIQGIYSASKHAVKGFTDSLRMELEAEEAPIYVSLIKPAAIDTPYTKHARNYMDREPKNPPPVYAPDVVAKVILRCATHPQRDVFVGAGGKLISAQGYYAPRGRARRITAASTNPPASLRSGADTMVMCPNPAFTRQPPCTQSLPLSWPSALGSSWGPCCETAPRQPSAINPPAGREPLQAPRGKNWKAWPQDNFRETAVGPVSSSRPS
jgi:short-subunit dehydrogenase